MTQRASLRLSKLLSLACTAVLSSAAAWAADAPTGGLDEIVVTATRHEEALSKVPVSLTAMTSEGLDLRGIKDIEDVARFTPGIHVDNSGTANISIRGIASSGGAGTTGIYVDDTPIQMRSLAFNPDESLPKSFDLERVEVLRGPQGTLFGAGSEGGTVRYITVQPSLTKTSVNGRAEVSFTPSGDPSYEAGYAAGGPLVDGTLGARITVWHRHDGGWIDRVDPYNPSDVLDKHANRTDTNLIRLAAIWAPNDTWTVTPSLYYQDREANDVGNYWPLYSNPSSHQFISANPTARSSPDKFYLPALKVEADLGAVRLISNTSYYHRDEVTGYDGTLYNLGFYQTLLGLGAGSLLLDQNGIHPIAPGLNYQSPTSINNGQRNFVQEIRLQSNDPSSKLFWTAGLFYGSNKQDYLEQLHDPMLPAFLAAAGAGSVSNFFGVGLGSNPIPCDPSAPAPHCGQTVTGIDPLDSYFLRTHAKDEQTAVYGEATYSVTDEVKLIAGGRFAKVKFSVDTVTGAAQLFDYDTYLTNSHSESVFTPKLGVSYQHDPNNLYYATYSKGFRPGGANNPVPQAACATDFQNFGITHSPETYDSDTVQSYEIGSKNNFDNRLRVASSVYYIKWHNIQQTVLPPVCQITWIQNLGEAVAKGADIQADIAVTPSFTAEFSAGYTDARYVKSSYVGTSTLVPPVAADGNAIVGQGGQPGSPVTVSLGLEYKFDAFGHESFVRGDWEYQGKAKWAAPGQDPGTLQYDDANYTLPATNFVTARLGMQFGDWQIAAFIDNLLDAHTVTNYNWTINPGVAAAGVNSSTTRLERDWTYRPRTIGFTFTYRH